MGVEYVPEPKREMKKEQNWLDRICRHIVKRDFRMLKFVPERCKTSAMYEMALQDLRRRSVKDWARKTVFFQVEVCDFFLLSRNNKRRKVYVKKW